MYPTHLKGHEFDIPYVVYYKTTVATPKTALAKMYEEKNEMLLKLKIPKTSYKEPFVQELLKWWNTNVRDESYYRDIAVHVEIMEGFEQTVVFTHASIVTKIEADTEGDMVTIFVTANQKRDKFVGVMFGDTLEETYQKAWERVNNPPRMNIVIPIVNKQAVTIEEKSLISVSNVEVEYASLSSDLNIDIIKVNQKAINKHKIWYEGNRINLGLYISLLKSASEKVNYYQLKNMIKVFGGELGKKNKNGYISQFTIETIKPHNKEKKSGGNSKTVTIDYKYADIDAFSNASCSSNILLNEQDNELYISFDFILELISGINSNIAVLTENNVLYPTFPTGIYNNEKVGYFDSGKYFVYNDYQLVKSIIYINHEYSDEEVLLNKFSGIGVGLSPYLTKFVGAGGLADAATILLNAVNATKAIYEYKCVDFDKIGGEYIRTFYVRKIIDKSTKDVNVPVPYKFAYITICYDSSNMDNIVYIEVKGDPVYKQDNNW